MAIKELHEEKGYPVNALCEILMLNRSSYYKWLNRDASEQEAKDADLIEKIIIIYHESNGIYGYRRIRLNLIRRFGLHCNKKRVYRVMRIIGLRSVIRRKRPSYLKSSPEIVAENILNRDFNAEELNEKWLTDVTEFRFGDGKKLFLSAILDLKDKSIISYEMGNRNTNKLVYDTFDNAVEMHPNAKPLFHSDRGFQYTSRFFKAKLDEAGMTQSMSRIACCIDNGPMEAFWGVIKAEMYYLQQFDSYDVLKRAIEKYIYFYNNTRYQEKLNGLAPLEYREMLLAA